MTSQLGKVSHTFAHMPQDDPQTRRLIHFGRQAARSSFPVLLCGEEGVGKALLSQAIHNESERAAGPYIAVNCELYGDAALAEEFIGGDRTDSENGRLSRLELAHGGTLFLERLNIWRWSYSLPCFRLSSRGYHATGCAAFNTH